MLVATVVVLILIVWIVIDYRRQKQRLRELEAQRRGQALRAQRDGDPMSEPLAIPRRRRSAARWLMALPLIAFAGLAVLFWFRLGDGDPSRIPSALIGHPAPQTALPPLRGPRQ